MSDTATPQPRAGIDADGIFLVIATIFVFLLPLFVYFPPVAPSRTAALLQTHSLLGPEPGDDARSKLRRQRRRREGRGGEHVGPTVRSLHMYPVDSCGGVAVTRAKVIRHGLEFDRLFAFAQLRSAFPLPSTGSGAADEHGDDDDDDDDDDGNGWAVITQRQFPRLATVQAELYVPDPAKKVPGAGWAGPAAGEVYAVLRFPRLHAGALAWVAAKLARGLRAVPEVEVVLPATSPADDDEAAARGYAFEQVRVGPDAVRALNVSTELPGPELARYLGVSNRLGLFRMECLQHPLHLVNLCSVRELEQEEAKEDRLQVLEPTRLRANIIVDGVPALDEKGWKKICFRPGPEGAPEACTFHVQEEGAPSTEYLGMQLTPLFDGTETPETMETWLEVDMAVDVVESGEHPT